MKRRDNNRYHRNTKTIRVQWTIICQQIWQPIKNEQVSLKLNQEEIDIWTDQWLEVKRISQFKILSKNKIQGPNGFTGKFYLPHEEEFTSFLLKTIPKDWIERNTPKDILWSQHQPDTKTRQRH